MLTYLDSLCDALRTRDAARIRALFDGHPLARLLPSKAIAEVRCFLSGKASAHAVPMVTLRFRDLTARLLSDGARIAAPDSTSTRRPVRAERRGRRRANQMELPLSA